MQLERSPTPLRRGLTACAGSAVLFYRAQVQPEIRLDELFGQVRDLTGYTADELLADPRLIRGLVHSDDLTRLDAMLADPGRAVAETGVRFVHRDGRLLNVEHVVLVTRDEDGATTAIEGVVRDVTPFRLSGDADREVCPEPRSVAGDDLPVVAYLAEPGRITAVTPAIESLTGFTAEEWIAQPSLWAERLHPDDRARVTDLSEAGAFGRPWQAEYRWLARDGQVIWIRHAVAPIRNAHGEVAGTHGFMTDAAARGPAAGPSLEAPEMQAIGRLAGVVAHDFNNLLAVVMGHVEMLLDTFPQPGPSRRSALEIKHAAEQAARITSQLLAVSGRQSLSIGLVDINDVVRDCADTLHELAGGRLDLRFDLARAVALVETDAKQVERVLRHLVVDAREAMPSGGHLTIATRASGDRGRREVVLVVSDNRPIASTDGAAPSFQPTVGSQKSARGSGLNRAAIYGIVSQLGGRVAAAGAPGGGVTFTIRLPSKGR